MKRLIFFTKSRIFCIVCLVTVYVQAILILGCERQNGEDSEMNNSKRIQEVLTTANIRLEIKKQAIVGEGALWNHKSKKLLWIDIDGKKLYEYDPLTKEEKEFSMPSEIGTVVPIDETNVAVALSDGIYTFNMISKSLVKRAGNPDKWRFNDGKCDVKGRMWVGTVETETYSRPLGNLYMVNNDFSISHKLDSVIVSNGITWSLDNKKMYYIDSPRRKVSCFDYDAETGNISNPSDCIVFPDTMGTPDGNTLDAHGNLWIGFWDGSCVVKCNPETGKILEKYEIPAHNVTSLAFGGENLETLFITTAYNDMSKEEKERCPDAGSVFSFNPGVRGIKANFFKPKEL